MTKKYLKRVIALFLIISMTFGNTAFVGKTYGASLIMDLFSSDDDSGNTGHENVGFSAYFDNGNEHSLSVVRDVNGYDANLELELDVKNVGYLKDANVEIFGENGSDLNFEVSSIRRTLEEVEKNEGTPEGDNTDGSLTLELGNDAQVINTQGDNTPHESQIVLDLNADNRDDGASNTQNPQETNLNSDNMKDASQIHLEMTDENNNSENGNDSQGIILEMDGDDEGNNGETPEKDVIKELKEQDVLEEYQNYVDSIESNKVSLKQINATTNVKLSIPLEYKNEKYVKENKLDSNAIVKLTGKYVDRNGNEHDIQKEYTINLKWVGKRNIDISSEITKYIDFDSGVIVQSVIKVDNSKMPEGIELNDENKELFKNNVPVRKTNIEIEVPSYMEKEPTNVLVSATKLEATNGQNAESITFGEDNWIYDADSKKLNIEVTNNPKSMIYSEDENVILDIENKVEEERLYNISGVDEYIVTYTYFDVDAPEEGTTIDEKVKVIQQYYGNSNEENISGKEISETKELKEQEGNLVSLDSSLETNKISKKFGYLNYRNENKFEKEIVSSDIINVSYKDIVENVKIKDVDTKYVFDDKEETTNDVYYKKIILSKANFQDIFGEEGSLHIFNEAGLPITEVNKNSWNNDDVLEVSVKGQKKIEIETSKPIKEGVLIIKKVRAMKESTITREKFIALKRVKFEERIDAKYQYVENDINVGKVEYDITLEDTRTYAQVSIGKSKLSTLTKNENVTFEIRLNNNEETSDIYGKSHFEIGIPAAITGLEIKDTNIVSAAGLEIENVVYEENKIKVDIKGMQNSLNDGSTNSGTIIMINTDIEVNYYTPARIDYLEYTFSNEEETLSNGEHKGVGSVSYSSPTGLVTINDISNYVENGFVTSVRQGLKEDFIPAHSSSQKATMGMTIINNNENKLSDVKILGRFPYKGVKDPITGDGMNVTVSAKSISNFVENHENRVSFKSYFSRKEDATSDLNDKNNGWSEILDEENAKSYLLIPEDENYEMEPYETLNFRYDFEIPENLGREEYIAGTYLVEYKNHSELGELDEKSCPDIVRLTTGTGPEMDVTLETDNEELYNEKEFPVKIRLKNTGKECVNNIKVHASNLWYVDFQKFESEKGDIIRLENNGDEEIIFAIDRLDIRDEIELTLLFMVNTSKVNMSSDDIAIEFKVEADDIGDPIIKKMDARKISSPDFTLVEEVEHSSELEYYNEETEIETQTVIRSYVHDTINNAIITKTVSNEFEIVSASVERLNGRTSQNEAAGEIEINKGTGEIIAKIDKLENEYTYYIKAKLKTREVSSSYDYVVGKINSKINADGYKEYKANEYEIKIAKVRVEIVQLTEVKNEYISVGDSIEYKFSIKNVGVIDATNITFEDNLPEGMAIEDAVYTKDGQNYEEAFIDGEKASVMIRLAANEEAIVNIDAVANTTNGSLEKTVINSGSIRGNNLDETSSKSVLHIIRARDKDLEEAEYSGLDDDDEIDNENLKGVLTSNNRISGKVWFDANENGILDNGESMNDDFKSITVDLLNVNSGDIVKTTKVGSLGEYRFAGVSNGKYKVVFEYDNVRYGITAYKKSGASENANSDAYAGSINKNGKDLKVAMTDEININNLDVDSINLGLVNASKFDLEIIMGISKITVQNEAGTKTTNYKNVTFAKEEISAKNVAESKVIVEYKIHVKNSGDVEGYAKKIVDYIPEGMEFNSAYKGNENWYTSDDGNVFSNILEKTELKPGETSEEVTLVLSKNMTEENTGMISNQAEIYEDYNVYGIADLDSSPGNKVQKEDDLAIADVLILLKTGEEFIMTSVIVTTVTLIGITLFVVYKRNAYTRKKRR